MTTATTDRDGASAPDGAARARPTFPFGVLPGIFTRTTPAETLQSVARLAREVLAADGAGIVLTGNGGGYVTSAASGSDAVRADALQVEHHEGPALSAIASAGTVSATELRSDSRWRFWGPMAADLGFRSVLSLPLVDSEPFGAVTLYSRRPSSFWPGGGRTEQEFAQQASLAITIAVEREQLLRARDSHGVVGQAQGILMERYQISADRAFTVLRGYSSQLSLRMRVVAEQVIRDRRLPEDAGGLLVSEIGP